jgi:hypothetical protein
MPRPKASEPEDDHVALTIQIPRSLMQQIASLSRATEWSIDRLVYFSLLRTQTERETVIAEATRLRKRLKELRKGKKKNS